MVPPRQYTMRNLSTKDDNTNQGDQTNPKATKQLKLEGNPYTGTQDDTMNTTQEATSISAQMAHDLQDNTKAMKDFIAMMSQIMPCRTAFAALQQMVALTIPCYYCAAKRHSGSSTT